MCTVQTLMFAPPGWIVSSTIEPNLSNSYPCNNPSPSASATVIVVHQSLTAGQGLAASTWKGRGNINPRAVMRRAAMSMIEPVSAFRRLMAELMNNSTKPPAVYQVGSATGWALSRRVKAGGAYRDSPYRRK